jgi:DNA-binding IclR family transcriptional regulator
VAAEKLQGRCGPAKPSDIIPLMTHLAQPPGRSVASRLKVILLTFRAGHTHSLIQLARLDGLALAAEDLPQLRRRFKPVAYRFTRPREGIRLSNQMGPPPRSLVTRIVAILLTFLTGKSHSVTEVARLTGLPLSTAHRLTGELASWHLLRRGADGRYEIGLPLQRLGSDAPPSPALADLAAHVVTDLAEVTRRRARLGVLRHGRVAYIEKQVGPLPATGFSANAVLPAHATALGKALLAFSPWEVVFPPRGLGAPADRRLPAFTTHTLTSPAELHRALHGIRLGRAAVARGELFPSDWAVAVPVFGDGDVVAALELEVHDWDADHESCLIALAVAARGLSRELAVTAGGADRPHLRLLPSSGGSDPAQAASVRTTAAT